MLPKLKIPSKKKEAGSSTHSAASEDVASSSVQRRHRRRNPDDEAEEEQQSPHVPMALPPPRRSPQPNHNKQHQHASMSRLERTMLIHELIFGQEATEYVRETKRRELENKKLNRDRSKEEAKEWMKFYHESTSKRPAKQQQTTLPPIKQPGAVGHLILPSKDRPTFREIMGLPQPQPKKVKNNPKNGTKSASPSRPEQKQSPSKDESKASPHRQQEEQEKEEEPTRPIDLPSAVRLPPILQKQRAAQKKTKRHVETIYASKEAIRELKEAAAGYIQEWYRRLTQMRQLHAASLVNSVIGQGLLGHAVSRHRAASTVQAFLNARRACLEVSFIPPRRYVSELETEEDRTQLEHEADDEFVSSIANREENERALLSLHQEEHERREAVDKQHSSAASLFTINLELLASTIENIHQVELNARALLVLELEEDAQRSTTLLSEERTAMQSLEETFASDLQVFAEQIALANAQRKERDALDEDHDEARRALLAEEAETWEAIIGDHHVESQQIDLGALERDEKSLRDGFLKDEEMARCDIFSGFEDSQQQAEANEAARIAIEKEEEEQRQRRAAEEEQRRAEEAEMQRVLEQEKLFTREREDLQDDEQQERIVITKEEGSNRDVFVLAFESTLSVALAAHRNAKALQVLETQDEPSWRMNIVEEQNTAQLCVILPQMEKMVRNGVHACEIAERSMLREEMVTASGLAQEAEMERRATHKAEILNVIDAEENGRTEWEIEFETERQVFAQVAEGLRTQAIASLFAQQFEALEFDLEGEARNSLELEEQSDRVELYRKHSDVMDAEADRLLNMTMMTDRSISTPSCSDGGLTPVPRSPRTAQELAKDRQERLREIAKKLVTCIAQGGEAGVPKSQVFRWYASQTGHRDVEMIKSELRMAQAVTAKLIEAKKLQEIPGDPPRLKFIPQSMAKKQ